MFNASYHHCFAFGFTELPLLGWLGVVAAPLLIQWWYRRKRREVDWGAMRFLIAAQRKQSRRVRWENALLTGLRMLILAGIVLAAAGPILTTGTPSRTTTGATYRVLVIDASYSMNAAAEQGTAWDEALRDIRASVAAAAPGDAWSVVLMADPSRKLIGEPTRDPEALLNLLNQTKPLAGRADLAGALRAANELLRDQTRDRDEFGRREVVVYSDLGETTWKAWETEPVTAQRAELARQLDGDRAVIREVGVPARNNLTIVEWSWIAGLPAKGRESSFRVQVKNHGDAPATTTADFLVGGQVFQRIPLTIPPHAIETRIVTQTFDERGDFAVEFRLGPDALASDDSRFLALTIRDAIRCLIVQDESGSQASEYLRFALDPESGRANAGEDGILVDVRSTADWAIDGLSQYQVVWFEDPATLSATDAETLGEYLDAGGGYVWWSGPRGRHDALNLTLGKSGANVLPVEFLPAVEPGEYFLDPLDYRHPLLSEFAKRERTGLTRVPLNRYRELRLLENQDPRAATVFGIRAANRPAFVTGVGEYRGAAVIAWPTAIGGVDPWTVIPALPAFHPLVQETLAYLCRTRDDAGSLVGDTLSGPWRKVAAERYRIERLGESESPLEKTLPIEQRERRPASRWQLTQELSPGVYRISADDPTDAVLRTVNVDPAEGDPTRSTLGELPAGWELRAHDSTDATVATVEDSSAGLQGAVLLTVLVLLVCEGVLAWWKSHSSGSTARR